MEPSVRIATLTMFLSDSSLNGDKTRLAVEADRLRGELMAIADSVNDVVTPAPERTRALDVPTIGAFVIALEPTRQIVLQVVRLADTWLRNRPARRVELEIGGEKIKMEGLGSRDIREITTKLMEVYARNSPRALDQGKAMEDET